jgi:hypothetical protein
VTRKRHAIALVPVAHERPVEVEQHADLAHIDAAVLTQVNPSPIRCRDSTRRLAHKEPFWCASRKTLTTPDWGIIGGASGRCLALALDPGWAELA